MTYLEAVRKLFKNTSIEHKFGEMGIGSKGAYKYPKHEFNNNRIDVEEYMGRRKISTATLDYADIQSDTKGNIVFHYYDNNDVLLMVKYRPSRKLQEGENKAWTQKDADTTPLLFNMNRIDPNQPLIITEGEIDCLSIIEAGYKNVVSIPLGAQNTHWIEECWDWLEQFDKIIIWSDNDAPGIKMRREVCHRLGAWRTYYIEIDSKEGKDANEILYKYGANRILEIIQNPIEIPITGIINASTVKRFDMEHAEGLYTNIAKLDNNFYKFVFGNLVIITGKRGDGKSSFANQIAVNQALNQGYDVFVYSQELPNSVLVDWIDTNLLGPEYINIKDGYIKVFDKNKYQEMREWYNGRLWIYDNSHINGVNQLLEKMEEVVRKLGTRVLLLDNLMTIDLSDLDHDSELKQQKIFIQKLVAFALKYNVLIFLVCHPRKGLIRDSNLTLDDVSGASEITNLAQYVLAVHRYTEEEKEGEKDRNGRYLKGKEPIDYDVCVTMQKNRITGDLPKVNMWFDKKSSRFYNQTSELWFRYKWDKSTAKVPDYNPKQKEEKSPL